MAAALCVEYQLISQQAKRQMSRNCSVHTITAEGEGDYESESSKGLERLEPKMLIKTDVIIQGEKYDEIMMEVRPSTKHDVIEKSHDLSHGGFGIQFNNSTECSLDRSLELEQRKTHVQFNESSVFIVEYDIDQMGNFKNIYLLAPTNYVFSGNYKVKEI